MRVLIDYSPKDDCLIASVYTWRWRFPWKWSEIVNYYYGSGTVWFHCDTGQRAGIRLEYAIHEAVALWKFKNRKLVK